VVACKGLVAGASEGEKDAEFHALDATSTVIVWLQFARSSAKEPGVLWLQGLLRFLSRVRSSIAGASISRLLVVEIACLLDFLRARGEAHGVAGKERVVAEAL
jgi:hypothetical protein